MKTPQEVNAIMAQIPESWRARWCGGENGPCACMGCVQIGNRVIMAKAMTGVAPLCDPEYIRESRIAPDVYARYKITREEWEAWRTWRASGPGTLGRTETHP